MASHAQRNLLHAYLDDELDLVRSLELEDHLAECSDCAQEVASYRALRESIQGVELRYRAPQAFRTAVMQKLQDAERPQKPVMGRRHSVPWWSWAPVAASLLIAVLVFVTTTRSRHDHDLAREIVADHVRSLMASHLTDVQTSDQHTVKPWFSGKTDFSPQVRDLSNDGFELVGGRLEYFDGHTAAAIVYQKRKHLINVFTWPTPGVADQEPRAESQQGFNLIEWRQAGMHYCAVSDLNKQELLELVSLLRK